MIYLDTNVIIYAIENHPKYGAKCKKILEDIETGKLEACCSVLLLVEVISALVKINRILKKAGKRELSVRDNVDAILSLPFQWVELNFAVIRRASEYRYPLAGADYIHLASMELSGAEEIFSADEELDTVAWAKRTDPLVYK
jgi:predicted nucleic acid-binding protein